MTKTVEIYIATHKKCGFLPSVPGFVPIHAGRALSDQDLGIIGDDTGDNISHLNPNFCELTVLYWAWKNSAAAVKGLVHYRRYFTVTSVTAGGEVSNIVLPGQFDIVGETHDLIVAQPQKFYFEDTKIPRSVDSYFREFHNGLDLLCTRDIIEATDPSYLRYFDFVMSGNALSPYNMLVASDAVFDSYCRWLFDILFRLKTVVPYERYDPYQARVFGFIAERLLNVWICRNRNDLRVMLLPVNQVVD